jgi:hypothetical protein
MGLGESHPSQIPFKPTHLSPFASESRDVTQISKKGNFAFQKISKFGYTRFPKKGNSFADHLILAGIKKNWPEL